MAEIDQRLAETAGRPPLPQTLPGTSAGPSSSMEAPPSMSVDCSSSREEEERWLLLSPSLILWVLGILGILLFFCVFFLLVC